MSGEAQALDPAEDPALHDGRPAPGPSSQDDPVLQLDPDGSALPALTELARAAGRLALDTEFMGEGRYRTLLCLIQLAAPNPDGERFEPSIELLDPLSEQIELGPLAEMLAAPAVELLVHAGRQDIALLRRRLQSDVSNVFDTQIAAGFAGLPAQCSYDSLLGELLGVRLAKSASFTRWDARPLSAEQLSYAREDVVHLPALAEELQSRLRTLGRLEWARQECAALADASDERDLEVVFGRLPRIRGLSAGQQAVARELVQWREQTAETQNRPIQSVLGDAVLVEIAKRRPGTTRQLQDIRGVTQSVMRRRGNEVLEAVGRGRERPHEPLAPSTRPAHPEVGDAPLIALGEALVRTRAREADLAYELIAARADLQAIVVALRTGAPEPDIRTLRGWRRELVGAELLELLDGGISLSVKGGRLAVERRPRPAGRRA